MSLTESQTDSMVDQMFTLLSNPRRRHVLDVLSETHQIDRCDLVDRVSEYEYDKPFEQIDGDERHRVYVSLQQTHLDALEDAQVIRRDRDRITRGERFEDARRYYESAVDALTDEPQQSVVGRLKQRLWR